MPSFESQASPDLRPETQESVQEAISRLAYSFWLERQGTEQGSAEEDWFRAEQELRGREPVRN